MKLCYICCNGRQCLNGIYCMKKSAYMEYMSVETCEWYDQQATTKVEKFNTAARLSNLFTNNKKVV